MDIDEVIDTFIGLDYPALEAEVRAHPEYFGYTDMTGNYLCHAVCERKLFSLLIDLYKIKGDVVGLYQNAAGNTVLHMLARAKNTDVFLSILHHCPGALSIGNRAQHLPIHILLDYEEVLLSCQVFVVYSDYFNPLLQDKLELSFLHRFDQRFFTIQKICWEFVLNGDFETYNMLKTAVKIALKVINLENLHSEFPNITDIRVMKELKISILHEAAISASLPVFTYVLNEEKDLCLYCDMNGMCPLMRLLASPNPDFTKILLFLSQKKFVLMDNTKKSIPQQILCNRNVQISRKITIFDAVLERFSQEEMEKAFLSVDKTGHTLLSVALLEMPVEFIERIMWVYMSLLGKWSDLYGKNDEIMIENPLILAIKSGKSNIVRLFLSSGMSLFASNKGNSSPIFTLFRLYHKPTFQECISFYTSHRSLLLSDIQGYIDGIMTVDRERLKDVLEPVGERIERENYSAGGLFVYFYALQTLVYTKNATHTLPIELISALNPDFSLVNFVIFALIAYHQSIALEVLVTVPEVREVMGVERGRMSPGYADEMCRMSNTLVSEMFRLGYRVEVEETTMHEIEPFLDNLLRTCGKSYPYIQSFFSLLDTIPDSGVRTIEQTLIDRSIQCGAVSRDLILFYTNVMRHYQKHNPIWMNVLFGILQERDLWGSRLIISVLIELCKDGLVQLPMKIMKTYVEKMTEKIGENCARCEHCHHPTNTEEKPPKKVNGEVTLSDQRNELFFLINALEGCESEMTALYLAGTHCSPSYILCLLIRYLKLHSAPKLYFNRPYKYQPFVREWFEALPVCTCYMTTSQAS